MKKADFVRMVADRTGLQKKDTEATLDAMLDCIGDVLANGDKLNFIGFGVFEIKERPERTVRLPYASDSVPIPAAKIPMFRPGKGLKEKVRGRGMKGMMHHHDNNQE